MQTIDIINSIQAPVFTHSDLSLVLKSYNKPNDKIRQLIKTNVLIPLKRGMYTINNQLKSFEQVDKRILSNILYGPSYISSDFALYEYDIIPEAVFNVTSITLGRSRKFTNLYGTFIYNYFLSKLYSIGISRKLTNSDFGYLIASPEKALSDKIYLDKSTHVNSISGMIDYLENDLRIDMGKLINFDLSLMSKIDDAFGHKRISILYKLIKKIKKD